MVTYIYVSKQDAEATKNVLTSIILSNLNEPEDAKEKALVEHIIAYMEFIIAAHDNNVLSPQEAYDRAMKGIKP